MFKHLFAKPASLELYPIWIIGGPLNHTLLRVPQEIRDAAIIELFDPSSIARIANDEEDFTIDEYNKNKANYISGIPLSTGINTFYYVDFVEKYYKECMRLRNLSSIGGAENS